MDRTLPALRGTLQESAPPVELAVDAPSRQRSPTLPPTNDPPMCVCLATAPTMGACSACAVPNWVGLHPPPTPAPLPVSPSALVLGAATRARAVLFSPFCWLAAQSFRTRLLYLILIVILPWEHASRSAVLLPGMAVLAHPSAQPPSSCDSSLFPIILAVFQALDCSRPRPLCRASCILVCSALCPSFPWMSRCGAQPARSFSHSCCMASQSALCCSGLVSCATAHNSYRPRQQTIFVPSWLPACMPCHTPKQDPAQRNQNHPSWPLLCSANLPPFFYVTSVSPAPAPLFAYHACCQHVLPLCLPTLRVL